MHDTESPCKCQKLLDISHADIYGGLAVSFKRVLKLFRELEFHKQDTVTVITDDD